MQSPRDQQAPHVLPRIVPVLTTLGWSEIFRRSLQSDEFNSRAIIQRDMSAGAVQLGLF